MPGDLQGALVGDLEVADLLDVVAPELHPERVFLGGREDVEDATADRELATLLDQFDPGVRGCRERFDDAAEVGALAGAQGHRLQVAEALDLWLEHGTDGGDDDGDRACLGVVGARVGEAPQDGEAAADGVGAGESRSWGSVSHEGYSATVSAGRSDLSAAARSSASRPVAVTASTVRPASRASAATAKGRAAGGPTRSTCLRTSPVAAFTASARAASLTTASSRPCRLMKGFHPESGQREPPDTSLRAGDLQPTTARSLTPDLWTTPTPGTRQRKGARPGR